MCYLGYLFSNKYNLVKPIIGIEEKTTWYKIKFIVPYKINIINGVVFKTSLKKFQTKINNKEQ